MKTNAIIRIIACSLTILILSGILLTFLFVDLYIADGRLHFDRESYVSSGPVAMINQQFASTEIRNIDIEWVAGSIKIEADPSVTEINIMEFSSSDTTHPMVYKQSGQTLKIKFSDETVKFPSFGMNVDVSKDLVILVPENWDCNSIEIDAAATEVDIHNLQINELDFDGASGNLTLDNCNIVNLDIDTASGDVEFTGTLKELDFDAASAKFSGEFHQVPNKLNLDAMSGDLTLVLPEYCGFTCELDTMSGSFDSDFDFHTMGAHYACGDGACKIKISAMSGDVSILKGISTAGKNCDH